MGPNEIVLMLFLLCMVILFIALKNVEVTTGEFQHVRKKEPTN